MKYSIRFSLFVLAMLALHILVWMARAINASF